MKKVKNPYFKFVKWMNSTEKHDVEVKTFIFVCCFLSLFVVALIQYIKLNGITY